MSQYDELSTMYAIARKLRTCPACGNADRQKPEPVLSVDNGVSTLTGVRIVCSDCGFGWNTGAFEQQVPAAPKPKIDPDDQMDIDANTADLVVCAGRVVGGATPSSADDIGRRYNIVFSADVDELRAALDRRNRLMRRTHDR